MNNKKNLRANISLRLKTQLILIFSLVIVIVLQIIGMVTYKRVEDIIEKKSADLASQQFGLYEYTINTFANDIHEISQNALTISELNEYLKHGRDERFETLEEAFKISESTAKILNMYDFIDSIYYYGESGVSLGFGTDFNDVPIEKDTNNKFYKSDIYNKTINNPLDIHWFTNYNLNYFRDDQEEIADDQCIVAAKGLNTSGENVGVMVILIQEKVFSNLINLLNKENLEESYIINNQGQIIAHYDKAKLGTQTDIEIEELEKSQQNYLVNQKYHINFYHIEEMDWFLVSQIPLNVLYNDIYALRSWYTIVIAIGALLAIIFSSYFMYRITKPLDGLRVAMGKMEMGEIGQQLEEENSNELGMLGVQFNKMSRSIKNLIDQIMKVENEKRVLEKESLHSQINIHFLFNTLTTIKYMVGAVDSQTLVDSITTLGNFLYPIFKEDGEFWSIEQEINHIITYIKIMNYRFGNGIKIKYKIPQTLKKYQIPKFILQPIVENAISHGFEYTGGTGKIEISAFEDDFSTTIKVKDSGSGFSDNELKILNEDLKADPENIGLTKGHIGLANVNRRIKVNYGEQYGLKVQNANRAGACISIIIPSAINEKLSSEDNIAYGNQ